MCEKDKVKLSYLRMRIDKLEERILKLENIVSMVDINSCEIGDPHCDKNYGGKCSKQCNEIGK